MNAQLYSEPLVPGVDPMPTDVATPLQAAPFPLAPVGPKSVVLDFDGGRFSSEAGLVLLKDIDEPLGRTRALAAVLSDPREAHRRHCTPEDLLQQRVLHMAAGDAEANDSTRLRADPIFKLLRARLPAPGAPLASHPTLSRLENRLARTALSRLALGLLQHFLASSARPPPVIVRDVDATEAPVHGAQEQARSDGD